MVMSSKEVSMQSVLTLMLAFLILSCGRNESGQERAGQAERGLNVTDEGTKPDAVGPVDTPVGPVSSSPPEQPPTVPSYPKPQIPDGGLKKAPSNTSTALMAVNFELPARPSSGANKSLWATYYYTPRLFHVANGYELLQLNGQPLGPRLSKLGWCQSAMEGSVQIYFQNAWRTYNYAGVGGTVQVDCREYYDHPVGRTRYKVARGEFGDGVRNYILQPFRTIAVDPEVIPYGSVVYIPSARGLEFTLPSGQKRIHDGYFFAGDTGGLINGNHIDVFLGITTKTPFSWITSSSSSRIPYEVIESTDIVDALARLHIEN